MIQSMQERGSELLVPNVFHRVWLGGREPEWTRGFADTWLLKNPSWQLWQWDDTSVQSLFPLTNQDVYDRADELAPDHAGQLRGDVLRYEILQRYGGVYIDTDFECLESIEPLLGGVECFAAWEEQWQWVNNAILGSVAGHPLLDELVKGLARNVKLNFGYKPNRMSGPQYLTRVIADQAWEKDGSVTVFDKELFYPYLWSELERGSEKFEGAVAVHHWANKRRERGAGRPREAAA